MAGQVRTDKHSSVAAKWVLALFSLGEGFGDIFLYCVILLQYYHSIILHYISILY